jgi:peptidoglycan/xylan/chitin deacetylase (PgdA/CDA1 family)
VRVSQDQRRSESDRRRLRQLIIGIVALPLSVLPFVAYATATPEGRLVAERVIVALRPPTLPDLSGAQVGAARKAAPFYKNQVMLLAYHGIGSGSDAEGGFVISPARFGEQLATLKAAGMNVVTAAQVAQAFNGGTPLPDRAVMISFDDGRTDALLYADPMLAQAHMAATMFVITSAAADPGIYYASWSDLEKYASSGRWDIESHTSSLHHEQKVGDGRMLPALTSLMPGESLDEYRIRIHDDLANANAAITAHTGTAPVAFAYPFGAYGAERTNDPAIQKILRQEVSKVYSVAFHQDDQGSIPLASSGQDHLGLRRLEIGDWSGMSLLKQISASAAR